jgi:hypothetical protein
MENQDLIDKFSRNSAAAQRSVAAPLRDIVQENAGKKSIIFPATYYC